MTLNAITVQLSPAETAELMEVKKILNKNRAIKLSTSRVIAHLITSSCATNDDEIAETMESPSQH